MDTQQKKIDEETCINFVKGVGLMISIFWSIWSFARMINFYEKGYEIAMQETLNQIYEFGIALLALIYICTNIIIVLVSLNKCFENKTKVD